jgi:hypothetical protein
MIKSRAADKGGEILFLAWKGVAEVAIIKC